MTKEELEAKIAELEAENKNLLDENAKLQGQLEKEEKAVDAVLPTITVDKQKYKVLSRKFTFQGELVTFENLKKDNELQKKLVESGSGLLQKV